MAWLQYWAAVSTSCCLGRLTTAAGLPPSSLTAWLLWARTLCNMLSAGLLSVETYTCCDSLPPEESVRELLAVVDIFSPNLSEAESIVGPGTPRQVVERLLQLGARLVVLRMGEQGVLVAKQAAAVGGGGEQAVEWHEVSWAVHLQLQTQVMWQLQSACVLGVLAQSHSVAVCCVQVPAVPNTQVVDVTGCGNACCGGFLAGLQAGQGLRSSAVWGCVAGSIMAEAQGVPAVDMPRLVSEAHAKQQWLLRHMRGGQREPLVVAACVGVRPSPSPAAATTAAAAGRRWTRGAHCMLPRGSSSCRVVAAGAARLLL